MTIAAAQTKPVKNNIAANLEDHIRLVTLAALHGVQLIVFPEMSLTGYEREQAAGFAFTENDSRLDVLKERSVLHNMIIIAGAPVYISSQLHIGAFIIFPDNRVLIYTKQFLHMGEDISFTPSFNYNPIIALEEEVISLAICADITNTKHPANASLNKTTLYIAGIFYSPNGIGEAYEQLSSYSRQYSMNVLMANFGGPSYQGESAGQSAFWNSNGKLVGKCDSSGEELLIVEKSGGDWIAGSIKTFPN